MKRKPVTVEQQREIWNCHIGIEHKEATCPLCGKNVIKNPSSRKTLECAHIVAEQFDRGVEPSPLSMYPSCASCNNGCNNVCLLDHLYLNGKVAQLRRMIKSIHAVYTMRNPELEPERLLMHNVIDELYGYERYKAGGGIINEYEIRIIARSVHMKLLMNEVKTLTKKLQKQNHLIEMLHDKPIGRKKPRFA